MRTTLKKVSAMFLAILMVMSMASLLASAAVTYDVKNAARKLGNPESLTLGTSAQYATLGISKSGKYFADAIAVWGFNGITSYAPLSNQNGIDIFVECAPIQGGGYKKNIYIDLGAWADGEKSANWAKYGTKTITIAFNAKSDANDVLTWTAVPATVANPDDMLQFFSFQVDLDPTKTVQQIQLFKTDTAANIANGGDNGVFNVFFKECTKPTTDNQASTVTTAEGYVRNMDAEKALWFDYFYNTHAYTKFFGYDFNIAGQTSYNSDKTNAKLDFVLTAGKLVTRQWDVATSQYAETTNEALTGPLALDQLKLTLPQTKTTDIYNSKAYDFFLAAQAGTGKFDLTMDDPRIGTTTLVPADAKVTYTYTGLKGYLRLTWTTGSAVTGLQTLTATGGENGDGGDFRLVANQSLIRTAAEVESSLGTIMYFEYVAFTSGYQGFGTPTLYPANQNAYADIIYKTARANETNWSFDQKILDLTEDMNLVDAKPTAGKVDLQLVPVIGGTDLIAGLDKKDPTSSSGNKLRQYGLTVNYYVDYSTAFMSQMTIDIHDKTLDTLTTTYGKANLVVKVTEGKIVDDFECTITQYDETFVIPLLDGTFTLLRIKVRTNYDDQVSPLALADITDFNYSRLTFVEQIKFYGDRLVNADGTRIYGGNANKVLYIDMINGIPGSGDAYWNYNTATPAVGTFKPDGYNAKTYYTKLTDLLSYVGFNADGSKPVRNPVGYAKFYNTIDTTLSLTAKQLWDTSFRLVYTKGTGDKQETITEVFYPLTPAQTLKYTAADGNTYVYSVFFHTQYGDMPVAATSLGVAQKSDAKITAMGEYTYAIAAKTADTGKGFAIGDCTKTEKKGTITVTNYWDNTRALATTGSGVSNYNKAITILSVRIPAGATLSIPKNGSGVNATIVDLKYGTLGVNSVDGLVDAYVTIEYATVSDTTFTLTVNYADGPKDDIKGVNGFSRSWDVKSTWVFRTTDPNNAGTKAYNAFTSRFGTAKTLTPAAAVMPSNPNEAQVVSSTPAVSTVVSAPSETSAPAMGNPFNAIAYIITIGASAIGGVSTLIIRKRK